MLLIKELVAELDQEKYYKSMSDVQKETLSLGHSIVGNYRRAFEISKENVELNIRNKNFDAAQLFYDNLFPSALSLGEIEVLTSIFNQLDRYYASNNNLRERYNLNTRYSLGMLEFSVYKNDINEVMKYMNKFFLYFDAAKYEESYRKILSHMSPETRRNPLFMEKNAMLLEKYKASETSNNAYIQQYLDGMEELFFEDSDPDESTKSGKKSK